MVDLNELAEAVINGNRDRAVQLTQQALDEGMDAARILNEGLIAGMQVVGEKFKKNEFYIPEVLVAARAMKAAMEVLRPILTERSDIQPLATVVIGTVRGDLHDIGKNLVAMMLEGAGFRVIDLGVDTPPEKFVEAVKEHGARIVGMSALLTTTMPAMKDTIETLKAAGIRDQVIIMVGGAPLTQEYADSIGADGYAPDAASAVDKAKELLSKKAA
ncbi:MAG: corrinoid protein [Armatimonadota bacterium]|nr:corrinoid protein [Armatimonadota bacterium]MCX7776851.1 corrinoid protein [Armatimonadota bacterium]MDW8024463.1 corrinoid protein [Armatimonadota bacterium]